MLLEKVVQVVDPFFYTDDNSGVYIIAVFEMVQCVDDDRLVVNL